MLSPVLEFWIENNGELKKVTNFLTLLSLTGGYIPLLYFGGIRNYFDQDAMGVRLSQFPGTVYLMEPSLYGSAFYIKSPTICK